MLEGWYDAVCKFVLEKIHIGISGEIVDLNNEVKKATN